MYTDTCPVCGMTVTRKALELPAGHFLVRCCRCGHGFVLLSQAAEENLKVLYDADYSGFRRDTFFEAVVRAEIAHNFVGRIPLGARLLDVGCGNGAFMIVAQEAGYKVSGIDVSPAAVEMCRLRGLRAEVVSFDQMPIKERFDCITMWDVIEHIPALCGYIRTARDLLNPGGYLIIKTPCVAPPVFRMVQCFPWLAGALLHVPAHIQFFSRNSLEALLTSYSFDRIEWLRGKRMRAIPPTGSLRKKVGRSIVWLTQALGWSGNLYVMVQVASVGRAEDNGDSNQWLAR